jgi:anti-sigma28 factor (negative regulator of flagellin synthesis)
MNLAGLAEDTRAVAHIQRKREIRRNKCIAQATQGTSFSESRSFQHTTTVVEPADRRRAQKVNRIKQQILQGTYIVEATEVAKAMLRSESVWFLFSR